MWRPLLTLGLAVILDRLFGEPPEKVHPVAWMGRAVDAIGQPTGDKDTDLFRGLVAAAALPLASVAIAAAVGRLLNRAGPIPSILGGAFLLKSMFAIRAMTDEAAKVDSELAAGSSDTARKSLSRIVSRDVTDLDDSQIASATISSVAENVTDSVVGPLVAYGAFGLPGAAAYRAIDTIDSMIGYRGKYEHLGAAAGKARRCGGLCAVEAGWRRCGCCLFGPAGLRRAGLSPNDDQTTRPYGKSKRWLADRRNGRRPRSRDRKDRPLQTGAERRTAVGPRHPPGQPFIRWRGPRGSRHRRRIDNCQRALRH